jgi:hypothetical protein
MEIILGIVFVAIMIGVSLVKTRIPRSVLLPLSLFIGIGMLVWFWVFDEGELPARVIFTVLIVTGLLTTFRTEKAKRV